MRQCTLNNCSNKYKAKGYCQRHYSQYRNHGRALNNTIFDKRPAIIKGGVALIPLSIKPDCDYAIVDIEDRWVDRWNWTLNGQGYPSRGSKGRTIRLPRLLMDAPKGTHVDHINHNTLDNRRSNLRICTPAENIRNSLLRVDSKTGYKGVSKKLNGNYHVTMRHNKKTLYIGTYKNKIDAAKAYDTKAKELFGEFALTNFPSV